jgi:uncharacterized protein
MPAVTRLQLIRTRLRNEGVFMTDTVTAAQSTTEPTTGATTTHTTTAVVPTNFGSRYLQQLAKHWSHKLEVAFDPAHATIRFPSGAVAVLDADDAALTARIDASDAETLERMKDVVASHLDRFAFREAPLPFLWR